MQGCRKHGCAAGIHAEYDTTVVIVIVAYTKRSERSHALGRTLEPGPEVPMVNDGSAQIVVVILGDTGEPAAQV